MDKPTLITGWEESVYQVVGRVYKDSTGSWCVPIYNSTTNTIVCVAKGETQERAISNSELITYSAKMRAIMEDLVPAIQAHVDKKFWDLI